MPKFFAPLVQLKPPRVQITALLRSDLEALGYDVDEICNLFAEWKSRGATGEYLYWFFGKDGEYAKPLRSNKRVLRHVHLPPETDEQKAAQWDVVAKRCGRKTSDTALVYAYDARHGYLLMYIAREPEGHALADLSTPDSLQLMEDLCDVAEAFIHDGSVTI